MRLPAIVIVSVVVGGLVAPLTASDATPAASSAERAATQAGGSRWGEPRLTGGAALVPFGARASGAPWSTEELMDLARAATAARERAQRQPGAATWRALAAVQLAEGKPQDAVTTLDDARLRWPFDAATLSDLAAAQLTLAARDPPTSLSSVAQALEHAEQALQLAPRLAEARFNAALALEGLFLFHAAGEAWERSLTLDAQSAWAAEARARLERMRAPTEAHAWDDVRPRLARGGEAGGALQAPGLAARGPDRARVLAYEELLPAWALAVERGDAPGARRQLSALEAIARTLAPLDALLTDTLTGLRAALDAPDGARLSTLARAHRLYGEGRRHYSLREVRPARDALQAAHDALSEAHSPFAEIAAWALAVCQYQEGGPVEAARLTTQILSRAHFDQYPHVRALAGRLLGLARLGTPDTLGALRAYREALEAAQAAADIDTQCGLWQTLDETLEYLGEGDQAWRARFRALAFVPRLGATSRAQVTLDQAATAAQRAGLLHVARRLFDEYVRLADASANPVGRVVARARRAEVRRKLGDAAGAKQDLAQARAAAEAAPAGVLGEATRTELWLSEGEVLVESDPPLARASLVRARESLVATRRGWRVANVDMTLARAALGAGQSDEAYRLLARALQGYEREPRVQSGIAIDDFALGRAREALQALVEHEALQRGRFEAALEYVERGRARITLDALSLVEGAAHARAPLSARALQARLPPATTVVVYATLPRGVLAWRLRRGSLRGYRLDVPPAQLAHWSARAARGRADGFDALMQLGRALLPRVLRDTRPGDALVFVADGVLHQVPFAALVAPSTGRALVEDHPVSTAPSASLFVHALERDRILAAQTAGPGLIVTDPEFDRTTFPDLEPLPGARAEGQRLQALVPEARLLSGSAATPARVLAALEDAGWLHVGAHARVNQAEPLHTALLLTPDPGVPGDAGAGLLTAGELRGISPKRLRLVVLGACSTGAGRLSHSEGLLSLARLFLERGVPAVVAARWAVADEAAHEILTAFHEAVQREKPLAVALREAQLAFRSRHPGSLAWAAFDLIGASAGPLTPAARRPLALPIAPRSD